MVFVCWVSSNFIVADEAGGWECVGGWLGDDLFAIKEGVEDMFDVAFVFVAESAQVGEDALSFGQ